MSQMQYQLKWLLMVATAVIAIFIVIVLPTAAVEFLALYGTILGIIILVPVGVAPFGRRIEAAYWAVAIHPLLFLIWLSAWRLPRHCPPLNQKDKNMINTIILTTPYIMVYLSQLYMPLLGILGLALAVLYFPRRSIPKPLLFLPIAWLTTLIVLEWDPFELSDWFWD